jgi:hypothetical protein
MFLQMQHGRLTLENLLNKYKESAKYLVSSNTTLYLCDDHRMDVRREITESCILHGPSMQGQEGDTFFLKYEKPTWGNWMNH